MSENRSASPGAKDNAECSASPRSEDVLRSIGLNVCAEVTSADCVRKPCCDKQGSGSLQAESLMPLR